MAQATRVLFIGLDSADPELVFRTFAPSLPHLSALRRRGQGGPLASTIPPITVPAWASMMTGCSPGTLGIYGFRQRRSRRYDDVGMVDSRAIRQPVLWQMLSSEGRPSVAMGVPPSYPIMAAHGRFVSCFLTPGLDADFAHPPELKRQILRRFPDFAFDVAAVRSTPGAQLLPQLLRLVDQHFAVFQMLLKDLDWRFAALVCMAPDRAHHGLWHHRFPAVDGPAPDPRLADGMEQVYRRLDERIGELLAEVPQPGTAVFVASDHGATDMRGGFCINQWLQQRGDLAWFHEPHGPTPLEDCRIDWSRTRAWSEGGYSARIYFNVRGREPQGQLSPEQAEDYGEHLRRDLLALAQREPSLRPLVIHRPEHIYPQVAGVAPDLLVSFGGHQLRSIGSVGHGELLVRDNDTGPDGANHSPQGLWIASGAGIAPHRADRERSIIDVAPTILQLLGAPIPLHMDGRPFAVDGLGAPASLEVA